MWELDCEESWVLKNWCFWTVVLEKTLESPLDSKEIQPVHSEGDQSWVFTGRNDAKAETPVVWPPHAKSWLTGKDWCWQGLGAGGEGDDRGWDGWMASPIQWRWVWVNSGSWWWTGRPGVSQDLDMTEWLNWTDMYIWGIPDCSKNPPANAGDTGLISGLRRSPGQGNGNSLQYSCLGCSMDRGAWWAIIYGVTKESDMT